MLRIGEVLLVKCVSRRAWLLRHGRKSLHRVAFGIGGAACWPGMGLDTALRGMRVRVRSGNPVE